MNHNTALNQLNFEDPGEELENKVVTKKVIATLFL